MGTARPNFFGFIQSAELGIEVLAGRRGPRCLSPVTNKTLSVLSERSEAERHFLAHEPTICQLSRLAAHSRKER